MELNKIIEKLKFFFENQTAVHILSNKPGHFWNGEVLNVKDNFAIIYDYTTKKNNMVFFSEMTEVMPYREEQP